MLVAKEVDGIEMGVLADGTPFLTGAGLAKACGVNKNAIYEHAKDWKNGRRDGKLARLLADAGFDEPLMYVPLQDGRVYAFTDSVCTIVIEYYAVENANPVALGTMRIMMRTGLDRFIYRSIGYDPRLALPPSWREFQDRLLLATAPNGYFSLLRELSEFLLRAIQSGMPLSSGTVPDISVGKVWSSHWEENQLAVKFGDRMRWEHNYPDRYPQAASNPQEIWVYPVEAIAAFRRWLDEVYIPGNFPAYLERKVKQKVLVRADADRLLAAVTPALLRADD